MLLYKQDSIITNTVITEGHFLLQFIQSFPFCSRCEWGSGGCRVHMAPTPWVRVTVGHWRHLLFYYFGNWPLAWRGSHFNKV